MFDKLKQRFTKKKGIVNQDGSDWHISQARSGCYGLCSTTDGAYDNLFPDVSRIAEQVATILPYAINAEGERLNPQPQAVKALYSPNKEMSGPEFFEAFTTMALIHPTVYILVHRIDGLVGEINPDNIGGFTFLEGVSPRRYADGSTIYQYKGNYLDDRRVMAISLNVNPYNVIAGYSPATAAKKWATLDDYIVDWQSGTFRNNAIPAGEFIITARDADEFNAIVDEMERKHKGAGRNNNVSYVHRPTSSIDGKPLPAQIEWVPFAQSPKELDLDSVFNQANKKTAMAFGVPEEIKGFVQNSNYASVATAERIFDKYTILPKATKLWAKFTHELNRITGGLGYAITFDYEPAQLADEDKVNAETTRIQLETLKGALEAGFELDSAVVALGLPESFKMLNMQNEAQSESNEEVVEDFETEASQVETSMKSVKGKTKTVASDLETEMLLQGYTMEQIEAAINGQEFDTEKESKKVSKSLFKTLIAGAIIYALAREKELEIEALAKGYDISKLTTYTPSEELESSYQQYLSEVMFSYSEDTQESIRRVLMQGEVEGWTQEQINLQLREILNNDFWRIKRLQRTESHRANQLASIDMAKVAAKEIGIDGLTKTWHVNPASENHCDTCLELDGVTLPIDGDFEQELGIPFSAGMAEGADAHPNCVLGDTEVLADQVKIATKFNYSGDVVKLTTAKGRVLTVTPNHILLTDKGWIRAKSLAKGDKAVAYSDRIKSAILSADPTNNNMKTKIADVFATLGESLEVTTTSMPLSSIDFKGDAVENEKVDIILPKSLEGNKGDATASEFHGNLNFVGSVKFAKSLDGFSTLHQSLVSVLLAASGVPSIKGLGFSLSDCETSIPQYLGFAISSWYNSRIEKSATDSASADTELLRKSILANAGLIEFDDIVDVETNHVENTPVYDLQTLSTLYVANGIVSSNCACYLTFNIPDLPKAELEVVEKSVKIKCPKCKRYICEAQKGAKLSNVVCSRCGEHFDREAE